MRRADDPIMVAARNLVETLAQDPAFVTEIADREIERRVAAGLLIPVERLQVAPGLTLAPIGRVEELESTLNAVLTEAPEGAIPQALIDKATALLSTNGDDGDDDDEEPALPGVPDVDETADEDDPAPEAEDPAPEDDDKPRRRRLPTEPGICAGILKGGKICGAELDLDQTKLSIIRFRKPLCKPCMASE